MGVVTNNSNKADNRKMCFDWLTSGLISGKLVIIFAIFAILTDLLNVWGIVISLVCCVIACCCSFGKKTPQEKAKFLYSIGVLIIVIGCVVKAIILKSLTDFFNTIAFKSLLVYILMGLSCTLWDPRKSNKQWYRKIKVTFLTTSKAFCIAFAVLCYVFACTVAMIMLYTLHNSQQWLAVAWSAVRNWFGVGPHIGEISWVSLGATFLAGCLLVISWSKEVPCHQWNPYSAHELGISESYPFWGIGLWCCVICATIYDSPWLAAILCIILLCSSIMTSVRCYQLQDDQAIGERIIHILRWDEIVAQCEKSPLISLKKNQRPTINTKAKSWADYRSLSHYTSGLQKVSTHIIEKMEKDIGNPQIPAMAKMIDSLASKGPTSRCGKMTAGLITGMGCVPQKVSAIDKWKYYRNYIHQLFSQTISSSDEFHQCVAIGLLIGTASFYYQIIKDLPYEDTENRTTDSILEIVNSRLATSSDIKNTFGQNPEVNQKYTPIIDDILAHVERHFWPDPNSGKFVFQYQGTASKKENTVLKELVITIFGEPT